MITMHARPDGQTNRQTDEHYGASDSAFADILRVYKFYLLTYLLICLLTTLYYHVLYIVRPSASWTHQHYHRQ